MPGKIDLDNPNREALFDAILDARIAHEDEKKMTNGELIRYSDYDTLAAFLHLMQAGAIILGKADSEETLREWLDEDAEEE